MPAPWLHFLDTLYQHSINSSFWQCTVKLSTRKHECAPIKGIPFMWSSLTLWWNSILTSRGNSDCQGTRNCCACLIHSRSKLCISIFTAFNNAKKLFYLQLCHVQCGLPMNGWAPIKTHTAHPPSKNLQTDPHQQQCTTIADCVTKAFPCLSI